MKRRTLALFGVSALVAGMIACSSANPAAPVAPATSGAAADADGSTLKVTTPIPQSPVDDTKLQSATVVLTATAASLKFESATPVALQYRFQVFNPAGTKVDEALVSSPTYQVASTLAENTRHTWTVRAEALGEKGPISGTASFITQEPAIINDPLTDGTTKGARIGGTFIVGQGWQSGSLTDGINYDVANGCSDCRLEFDATNFGAQEGFPFLKDLKWVSMASAGEFTNFDTFRDGPFKMHLVQRADYPTGIEIVWRNGRARDNGDPGDHRIKLNSTPITFRSSTVYHFQLDWSPSGYNIAVNGTTVLADGWGRSYNPVPLRIQLGCIPRADSFVGIIYRNVKLTKH